MDADGNRADVIMDNASIDKRLNTGAFYEQYYGAVLLKTRREIKEHYDNRNIEKAWARIDRLYELMSTDMSRRVRETIVTKERKLEHIQSIIDDGFYIYLPTHAPNTNEETVGKLMEEFPICYGPVTFKGINGNTVTTKTPVMLGTNYMIMLHKIGDSWSAVTSSKLQHHGIPAKLNPADRNLSPGRKNPIKFPAEAEIRTIIGSCGVQAAIEITDRSNNPTVNQEICRSILNAKIPSNIEYTVDRSKFLYGGNRALQQTTHAMNCMGIRLKYSFENNDYVN